MDTETMNPYQPPKAQVDVVSPTVAGGSLEDALAGRYDFQIGEVMDEAWKLVKGFKASFWGAAIVLYLGFFVVAAIVGAIAGKSGSMVLSMVLNGILGAVAAPLMMGVFMMAVRRAAGLPVSFSTAFAYLNKAGVSIGAGLLVMLLTYVGLVLLVIPGIYLGLAYGMTQPLIADRNLGAWQAMETSRKAMTHKWFRFFGLYLVVGLLTGLSALPLGIPLIWTAPWSMLVLGVVYRRVFGVASTADSAAAI